MVASFTLFVVFLIVRIICGHVATVHDYLTQWLWCFTALVIAAGVLAVVFTVIKIVKKIKG